MASQNHGRRSRRGKKRGSKMKRQRVDISDHETSHQFVQPLNAVVSPSSVLIESNGSLDSDSDAFPVDPNGQPAEDQSPKLPSYPYSIRASDSNSLPTRVVILSNGSDANLQARSAPGDESVYQPCTESLGKPELIERAEDVLAEVGSLHEDDRNIPLEWLVEEMWPALDSVLEKGKEHPGESPLLWLVPMSYSEILDDSYQAVAYLGREFRLVSVWVLSIIMESRVHNFTFGFRLRKYLKYLNVNTGSFAERNLEAIVQEHWYTKLPVHGEALSLDSVEQELAEGALARIQDDKLLPSTMTRTMLYDCPYAEAIPLSLIEKDSVALAPGLGGTIVRVPSFVVCDARSQPLSAFAALLPYDNPDLGIGSERHVQIVMRDFVIILVHDDGLVAVPLEAPVADQTMSWHTPQRTTSEECESKEQNGERAHSVEEFYIGAKIWRDRDRLNGRIIKATKPYTLDRHQRVTLLGNIRDLSDLTFLQNRVHSNLAPNTSDKSEEKIYLNTTVHAESEIV